MPFWRSLILRGARPGGLQEMSQLRIEMQDTFAVPQIDEMDRNDYASKTKSLQHNYCKLPPAKRPNFLKLGFSNPFGYQWPGLGCSDTPSIVRNCQLLNTLNTATKKLQPLEMKEEMYKSGLVPVWLRCEKGRVEEFAKLYLPQSGDYGDGFDVKEPVHKDVDGKKRMAEIRKLRNKVKKASLPADQEQLTNLNDLILQNLPAMGKPCENEREEVGFVTAAGFSHSLGCSVSLGYVTYKHLLKAINNNARYGSSFLLARNINSYHYFRCRLSVSHE